MEGQPREDRPIGYAGPPARRRVNGWLVAGMIGVVLLGLVLAAYAGLLAVLGQLLSKPAAVRPTVVMLVVVGSGVIVLAIAGLFLWGRRPGR